MSLGTPENSAIQTLSIIIIIIIIMFVLSCMKFKRTKERKRPAVTQLTVPTVWFQKSGSQERRLPQRPANSSDHCSWATFTSTHWLATPALAGVQQRILTRICPQWLTSAPNPNIVTTQSYSAACIHTAQSPDSRLLHPTPPPHPRYRNQEDIAAGLYCRCV